MTSVVGEQHGSTYKLINMHADTWGPYGLMTVWAKLHLQGDTPSELSLQSMLRPSQQATRPVADLGGAPGASPIWPKIFSISCSFSENLTKSYVGTPRGWAPPPTGNPGSAPADHFTTLWDYLNKGTHVNVTENEYYSCFHHTTSVLFKLNNWVFHILNLK